MHICSCQLSLKSHPNPFVKRARYANDIGTITHGPNFLNLTNKIVSVRRMYLNSYVAISFSLLLFWGKINKNFPLVWLTLTIQQKMLKWNHFVKLALWDSIIIFKESLSQLLNPHICKNWGSEFATKPLLHSGLDLVMAIVHLEKGLLKISIFIDFLHSSHEVKHLLISILHITKHLLRSLSYAMVPLQTT